MGLLPLERRGAITKNLAGYVVVRNDYPQMGEIIFYKVNIEAETKLLGPSGVMEALEKDPDFRTLRTLLRTPRVGDNILYRVGEHDVYFIPVYTAGAGGVITEIGKIACVGAAFTGKTYVGLGDTAEDAFESFLARLAGVEAPPKKEREKGIAERKIDIIKPFKESNLPLVEPTKMYPDIFFLEGEVSYRSVEQWNATRSVINTFIENWCLKVSKVLMWSEASKVNFGVLVNVNGVIELHYISVLLE